MQQDLQPEDLDADYSNEPVSNSLSELLSDPNYERLADFLNTLPTGMLFADATGAISKKKGARFRTTRTTKGELVLPLFTSMVSLRSAVSSAGRRKSTEVKGVLMPALEALKLIKTDRFVAIEINPGAKSLVVLRKYIEPLLREEKISVADLQKGGKK